MQSVDSIGATTMDREEVKRLAAQILSGLLANPHIYASVSDEGAHGQQEQLLTRMAIEMAEALIATVEKQ
ncbi:MAG TPA: hypothetical protein V6C65_36130 [Allocoleopsis sp.]